MKITCALLLALMLLFAAVQHDDPDGALWAAVYAVPAAAMLAALARPALLATGPGRAALGLALAALAVGTWMLWPERDGFWRREVWWEEETVREGLGMAVALAVTAVALPFARRPAPGAAPRSASEPTPGSMP